jgi:di/tricarboxylate transporter
MQIIIVLRLLVLAIVLFASEKLPVDVTTLLLLVGLVASGVLTPSEAFDGFSSDVIIILGSIFIISGALQGTIPNST